MTSTAGYNRLPPHAFETAGDAVVDCYMSGPQQLANPRKRQRTERPLQLNETSQPQSKRQKKLSNHDAEPPAFWDNLSKIWLTKRALRELNRRNTQPAPKAPNLPYRRTHRPITRNFAKLNRFHRPTRSADDFLNNCTSRTLKEIKPFARHGGPDLSDLRGCPEPVCPLNHTMSSRSSSSRRQKRGSTSTSRTKRTTNTTATKDTGRSGPDHPNFLQNLIDTSVYHHGYKYPDGRRPPLQGDWEETNRRLAQHRPSLSPSVFAEEKYQKFVDEDAEAHNEDDVTGSVLPAMLDAIGASGLKKNILFTDIDPLTNSNTRAQPDYYCGAQPEQLDPHVRGKLSKHIIPSSSTNLPIVPNFFLEAKGPNGSGAVALRQACHNGAIGARAMQSLQSYGQGEPVYDNNTSAISTTYQLGQLKMYAHSIAQPNGPGTQHEYYMHQLKTWGMTGDKYTFLQGATAFKNAMDLTREYRDVAIARANEKAGQTIEEEEEAAEETEDEEEDNTDDDEAQASSSNAMLSFDCETDPTLSTLIEDEDPDDSETSIDELAMDCMRPPAKRPSSNSQPPHRRKRMTHKSSSRQGDGGGLIQGFGVVQRRRR